MRLHFVIANLAKLIILVSTSAAPDQTQSANSELLSYAAVLTAEPAYISLYSAYATNPEAAASVIAFRNSYEQALADGSTISPDFLQGLPTDAQGVIGSAYMIEASIIRKYGLDLNVPKPTKTETDKKNRSVRNSGKEEMGLLVAVAVGLGGFLGVLWVL